MDQEQVISIAQTLPHFDSEFVDFNTGRDSNEIVEDDGFLHININGTHVGFFIGEDASRLQFAVARREIAQAFNLNQQ